MSAIGAILPRPASRRCRDCDQVFTTNDLNLLSCYRCRVVGSPTRARTTGRDRDDILFLMDQVADLQRWKTVVLKELTKLERQCARQRDELRAARKRLRRLADLDLPETPPVVGKTLEEVRDAVCTAFDIPAVHLCSNRRHAYVARPRFAFFLLARERTVHSLQSIARAVGRSDHTTVSSGVASAKKLAAKDPDFADCLRRAREALADAQ
jgi:hypothetical protein